MMMLELFADLKAQGKTLLVCSHEWGDALQQYDRLLLLNRHLIANDAPTVVLTLENIRRAYGEASRQGAARNAVVPFAC